MSRFVVRLVLVAASALITPDAIAADWRPAQPLKFVVHTSPGAGADLFARHIADVIRQESLLPVPVEVINKSGGAGALAINFLAERKGDPTHIMAVTNVLLTTPLRQKGLPTYRDFQPVAVMAHDTNAIQVLASSPHKTVKSLIDAARAQPKKISHAFGAFGGTDHIIGYQLAKATGVQFSYVAFKGGGDAVTALLGGHVDFVTGGPGETRAHLQAGKLRALAVVGDRRLPTLPDVPTLTELGYKVEIGTGRGFGMPAGVPKEAVATMEGILHKAHQSALWRDYSKKNMYEDRWMGSAEFAKYLAEQRMAQKEFIDSIGLSKK